MGATFTAERSADTEDVFNCLFGSDHNDPTCLDCKGTGKVRFRRKEQEIHVSGTTMGRWLDRYDLEGHFDAIAGRFTPEQCEAITKHPLFGMNERGSIEARMDSIVSWAVINRSIITWG
jgi:hypothetical protein